MAFTNLTLNTKVYGATRIDSVGTSWWYERSGGTASSYSPLSLSITDPTASKRGRVGFRLEVPVTATVDTACVCAGSVLRTISVTGYADIPGDSTAAEKADALARFIAFVSTPTFANAFNTFAPPSAT